MIISLNYNGEEYLVLIDLLFNKVAGLLINESLDILKISTGDGICSSHQQFSRVYN
ncbi:MAG: hypothetical protein ACPGSD_02780 [Flavobacteriales bacterium]